jgi:release factor glutamine methyltransferase
MAQAATPGIAVEAGGAETFRVLVARRATREPMAYVRGRAEFWSLDLLVEPGVLVPRADTETLVEVATRVFPDRARPLRLLDIGVGSGCLILALLHLYPAARGVGTDTSAVALDLTARNAARLGSAERLELVPTGWAEGVAGPFDLVASNPPYIPTGEIDRLQPEVSRFEPRLALDGGADGLDVYRAILADLPRLLRRGGTALLEIGQGQEAALQPLAAARGFASALHRDLAGINRCLELRPLPPGD